MNCLDWQQAVDFCAWAGGRLPSEAEWEYAARSGGPSSSYKYPWGNDAATCTYAVMDDGGYGCGTGRTWSVCSKPAGNTSQGLCDMSGNVWEWVEDWYHGDYTGAPTDGSAWVSPTRLVPGVSWRQLRQRRRRPARCESQLRPSVGTYDSSVSAVPGRSP